MAELLNWENKLQLGEWLTLVILILLEIPKRGKGKIFFMNRVKWMSLIHSLISWTLWMFPLLGMDFPKLCQMCVLVVGYIGSLYLKAWLTCGRL